jgi:MYXO-CTERM domain-containing protein
VLPISGGRYETDPLSADRTPPAITTLDFVSVSREWQCGPDVRGIVTIGLDARDDTTVSYDLGFRAEGVASTIVIPSAAPFHASSHEFGGVYEARVAFEFPPEAPALDETITLFAVDRAGNESPGIAVRIVDDGPATGGCSTAPGSPGCLVLVVLGLLGRRRRR